MAGPTAACSWWAHETVASATTPTHDTRRAERRGGADGALRGDARHADRQRAVLSAVRAAADDREPAARVAEPAAAARRPGLGPRDPARGREPLELRRAVRAM